MRILYLVGVVLVGFLIARNCTFRKEVTHKEVVFVFEKFGVPSSFNPNATPENGAIAKKNG